MEVFYKIIALFGGLAMFLYGMRIMGNGLKNMSGNAMRNALAKVTNKPVIAFLLGVIVTCVIQSSTATIVLTVGFVGAGFLTFEQSIGVVLGANVGTAITAQIIRLMDLNASSSSILYFFKSDNLAPFALIIGIVLIMFIKNSKADNTGTILMGFGILFMGLMYMSSSVKSFGTALTGLLTAFDDNYILGFLSGTLVTGVIQSSSAVIGILQSIASSVGVQFCGVFAIIIGVNIGDCLTTFIVSRIGASPKQIRTATVHVIYNIIAAVLIIAALVIGRATGLLNDDLWFMKLTSGGVANVHGIFRLVPAILILPFSSLLGKLATKIVPDKPAEENDAEIEEILRELDNRFIENPSLALAESEDLIGKMSEVTLHNYEAAADQIFRYDAKRTERMAQRERLLDRMADASNRYLVSLSTYITSDKDSRNQGYQIKALTCFERIGDLAINISDDVENLRSHGDSLSETALSDLEVVIEAVKEILVTSKNAYLHDILEDAKRIEPMEEVIDELVESLKRRHIDRMTQGICNVYTGIQFENILSNLERVSDQCSDLAIYMLSRFDSGIVGQEHQYIHYLHHSNNPEYLAEFHSYYDKYFGKIENPTETSAVSEKTDK